jgi:hypothetical protein
VYVYVETIMNESLARNFFQSLVLLSNVEMVFSAFTVATTIYRRTSLDITSASLYGEIDVGIVQNRLNRC